MKITRIEAQVKIKGRYSVYVDDKFEFGISELGLINSGIRVGRELTKEELEALKSDAATDKLHSMTLALIARRPRSRWEVEDYLRRKQADPEVAEEILRRLSERGMIDDLDFARRWIESRRLLKPISSRKLELELRAKRLSNDVIREAMAGDDTDEYQVLVAEVEKKRRQSRYQDESKLMQYLARQGYSYEDIKRALADDAG